MKKTLFIAGICIFMDASYLHNLRKMPDADCALGDNVNPNFPKARVLDSILKAYTPFPLPGMAMAVYSESGGWWANASGLANLETKTPMENCHLQYLQSVSKSFMAVEILQLMEEGKIRFECPDDKIPAGSL